MNFAFLGSISFIPFPTSLISEHPDPCLSVVIFSLSFVFAGLMLALMSFVKQSPEQRSPGWQALNPAAKRTIIGMPLIGTFSILLAILNPRAGVAFWLILPFIGIFRNKGGVGKKNEKRA